MPWQTSTAHIILWRTTSGTCRRTAERLGDDWLSRGVFDNWIISGISSIATGNPAELVLSIAGQDAGNRLVGAYSNANLSGQQPRLKVKRSCPKRPDEMNATAFSVPGIKDIGPYPRNYLRNPGFNNHESLGFQDFPFGREGKSFLQLRMEMFNFLNAHAINSILKFVAPGLGWR